MQILYIDILKQNDIQININQFMDSNILVNKRLSGDNNC
ncbi:MAG: hypothetical protein K0S93_1717 [Nitrososphaeraceae archaeon]|jgi:hypothetical protein|nr:hypothetical protein [Nitrososphaeraceae archaeon]